MKLFKSKTEAAAAVTAEEIEAIAANPNVQTDAVTEDQMDSAQRAAAELEEYNLTPGAKNLLDRAMDNLGQNNGGNIEDADARAEVQMRAELISAAGNDLSIVIEALVDSASRPQEVGASLYRLSYQIIKSAGFLANMDRQRWLDPRGDFDLFASAYTTHVDTRRGEDGNDPRDTIDVGSADRREDEPSAPDGLMTSVDRQIEWLRETYGSMVEEEDDVFAASLADLRLFLQLTIESFGWNMDAANRMDGELPYVSVMNADGSFERITDPVVALDHHEIKRQESRIKRRERQAVQMSAAQERAKAILAKRMAR
mgnify:FL=1